MDLNIFCNVLTYWESCWWHATVEALVSFWSPTGSCFRRSSNIPRLRPWRWTYPGDSRNRPDTILIPRRPWRPFWWSFPAWKRRRWSRRTSETKINVRHDTSTNCRHVSDFGVGINFRCGRLNGKIENISQIMSSGSSWVHGTQLGRALVSISNWKYGNRHRSATNVRSMKMSLDEVREVTSRSEPELCANYVPQFDIVWYN